MIGYNGLGTMLVRGIHTLILVGKTANYQTERRWNIDGKDSGLCSMADFAIGSVEPNRFCNHSVS